jgi:hypothetical protein
MAIPVVPAAGVEIFDAVFPHVERPVSVSAEHKIRIELFTVLESTVRYDVRRPLPCCVLKTQPVKDVLFEEQVNSPQHPVYTSAARCEYRFISAIEIELVTVDSEKFFPVRSPLELFYGQNIEQGRYGIVKTLIVIPLYPYYLPSMRHTLYKIEKIPFLIAESLRTRLVEKIPENNKPTKAQGLNKRG